jgi:hypothetical protein
VVNRSSTQQPGARVSMNAKQRKQQKNKQGQKKNKQIRKKAKLIKHYLNLNISFYEYLSTYKFT